MAIRIVGSSHVLPPPEQRWGNEILMRYLRVPNPKGGLLGPDWPEIHLGMKSRGLFGDFVERDGVLQFVKPRPAEDGIYEDQMFYNAIREALEKAAIEPARVDRLIMASCTPSRQPFCGQNSVELLRRLQGIGLRPDALAIHVNEGCGGPAVSLDCGVAQLARPDVGVVVLAAANDTSSFMHLRERFVPVNPCPETAWAFLSLIVFGDGAGALVLLKDPGSPAGLMASHVERRPEHELVRYLAGGAIDQTTSANVDRHVIVMNPKAVAGVAKQWMRATLDRLLAKAGVGLSDVNKIIIHQVNGKVPPEFADELGLPRDKVPVIADIHGNPAAASTFIAFDMERQAGRLGEGDLVAFVTIGGGMGATLGGAVFRL